MKKNKEEVKDNSNLDKFNLSKNQIIRKEPASCTI